MVLERYRRGHVAELTLEDAAEIFRLRGKLEGHGARRAARRISGADIARLEDIEARLEAAFAERGWHQHLALFDELNNEFHGLIAAAADSPRLGRDPRLVAGIAGLDLQSLFRTGRRPDPPDPHSAS